MAPRGAIGLSLPKSSQANSTFTVPVIPNPNFRRDGFFELSKAYRKYQRHFSHLVIPPALVNYTLPATLSSRGSKTGSVVASPIIHDTMYLSPIYIGSQKFNMDFDTGSADLWVFSNKLPKTVQQQHKRLGGAIYKPAPNTKTARGLTWKIEYADGSSASGTVVIDKVKIGGIAVATQAVEVASKISSSFNDFEGDGLLGLGFSTINTVSPSKQKTWFENALPQLKSKVFTADLNKQAAGSYSWGFINTQYTKKVAYAKLRDSGWWHVDAAGGIKVNGKSITDHGKYTFGAVPDTGTTLILLPDSLARLYYAKVPGAEYLSSSGAWVYPCTSDSSSSMPSISLPVGNLWATIPGKHMTYAYANSAATMCFGSLQGFGDPDVLPFIYGDIFFKANFAVFDYGNRRFGFAQK
ncbi:Type I transmembrane sorting receptor [Drechslerella dactyloides]|uniref:Type I transmembrane sorting receptor n=1 Tax=Drechslerella dactyloides TaxID=74499 RepID=A0AAD6NHS6_DREDA|nr:Type I transmembrane sorting receptor [Drechslerella dactyloides]